MAIQGAIRVQFGDVFPHGAFAVAVEAVRDFDKSTREHPVQARDKESGVLVWAVEVLDADPEARASERSVKVKIAADQAPVMPDLMAGTPFRPVEFEGLRVRPYVNSQGRLAYSFNASAMRGPNAGGKPAAAVNGSKNAG
jgi:hypothetical protein